MWHRSERNLRFYKLWVLTGIERRVGHVRLHGDDMVVVVMVPSSGLMVLVLVLGISRLRGGGARARASSRHPEPCHGPPRAHRRIPPPPPVYHQSLAPSCRSCCFLELRSPLLLRFLHNLTPPQFHNAPHQLGQLYTRTVRERTPILCDG